MKATYAKLFTMIRNLKLFYLLIHPHDFAAVAILATALDNYGIKTGFLAREMSYQDNQLKNTLFGM